MKTILDFIQENKQIFQSTCNGHKTCGQCKIQVLDNIPITSIEKNLLTKEELQSGIRLACCHEYSQDIRYKIFNQKMDILEEMSIQYQMNCVEEGNGLIVDIGTTTVVMKWISLLTGETEQTVSFKNPQAIYGGDVISRIEYSTKHPHILNQILIEKLEHYILENEYIEIKRMIVCGNTVMTNLFLDCDISSLGHVPFHIPIQEMIKIESHKIFKNISQQFEIITFPHIAAFVGGDITAGILALNIDCEKEKIMLLDLGTNGEIVLGNKDEIMTTSTAAGPAFEGVGITCGGPSIPGAITSVKIDHDKIHYQTIANKPAQCLCGSGLISLIAELKRNDIIDEMGRFVNEENKFYVTDNIYITRKDIQTFQLAKAAIQAGVTTLLQEKGDVDEVYISGGFGAHVQGKDLIELNIFPKNYINRIQNINNSALTGAYMLLRSQDYERLNHIVAYSQNINLAEYPYFDDLLIDGLYFND